MIDLILKRLPKASMLMIFLYFSQFFLVILNWWWFVSLERALFGDALVNAHIAFTVFGTFIFAIFASPFLFWPYRYGKQMPARVRRNCVFLCLVIVFFTHDFPLWLMEFFMVWRYGWIHVLQGVSLLVLTWTTAIGLFGVWLGYTWKVSKLLQRQFGSSNYNIAGTSSGMTGPTFGRVAAGANNQRI